MLNRLNRRVFLRETVTAGAVLLVAGLLGCGGGGTGGGTAFSQSNPVPFADYYEGTYTRTSGTAGGIDATDFAQIRIYGVEDRQPERGRDIAWPAIEPGQVQGFLGYANQTPHYALAGNVDSRGFLQFGVEGENPEGAKGEGTLTQDPETGALTGTFPLKDFGTNADRGTLSLSLTKMALGGGSAPVVDRERGWIDEDGRGIGYAETIGGIALKLRGEVEGPKGRD